MQFYHMNFIFSVISIFFVFTQAEITTGQHKKSTNIYYSTSNKCKTELQKVVYDPKVAALAYFNNLRRQIQAKAYLWFNPSTRISTIENFCAQNGISVSIYNAMGHFIQYPSLNTGNMIYPSSLRASELNSYAYSRGSSNSYYSFQMFSSNAEYMLIDLSIANTALPLNNYKYKKSSIEA